YGLASWMRPQQGGLPIQCGKKIHPATGKFWGGFLMSGLRCCKNIWMWYNKNRKTTAHKVGCRFKEERKSTPRPASFGVVFLCLDYLLN
ncbi:hypothetical protein, partial [Phascolarctobacterium succinatutens]|uniref:hypothetical protein n=1 Tax=Phascolarctobacterium succinatutens TaxID=626940 RepID=UPI001CA35967